MGVHLDTDAETPRGTGPLSSSPCLPDCVTAWPPSFGGTLTPSPPRLAAVSAARRSFWEGLIEMDGEDEEGHGVTVFEEVEEEEADAAAVCVCVLAVEVEVEKERRTRMERGR